MLSPNLTETLIEEQLDAYTERMIHLQLYILEWYVFYQVHMCFDARCIVFLRTISKLKMIVYFTVL